MMTKKPSRLFITLAITASLMAPHLSSITVVQAATQTTATPSTISVDAYSGIRLNRPTPTTLYKNETYLLRGQVTSNPQQETHLFAFLNYKGSDGQEHFINFDAPIIDGNFSIPLRLTRTGTYQLGIIIGSQGKSFTQTITVSDSAPMTKKILAVTPRLTYDAGTDTTSLTWSDDSIQSWYRAYFQQGEMNVTYLLRRDETISSNFVALPLHYPDFKNFKSGEISVTLNGVTRRMQIVDHGFRAVERGSVTVQGDVPSIMSSLSPITIQGVAKKELENEAMITKPDGRVESVSLGRSGSNFNLSYTPKKSGSYIVEVNGVDGAAVINVPVYVMTGMPLIPDYQDLLSESPPPRQTLRLLIDQRKMLASINAVRTEMGLSRVILNQNLNTIAQNHSNDMVQRNFFGHRNLSGETPDDRRLKANYPTLVGENLADAPTLKAALAGLLRSPIHRANILNPAWTRVGLGITKSSDGNFKVAQEFSATPLSANSLDTLKTTILTTFNNARTSSQPRIAPLTEETTLLSIATTWSQKLAQLKAFGLTTSDGGNLSQLVEAANLDGSTQIFIYSTNNIIDIASRIMTPSDATNSQWGRIGIGLATTKLGELKITILLRK